MTESQCKPTWDEIQKQQRAAGKRRFMVNFGREEMVWYSGTIWAIDEEEAEKLAKNLPFSEWDTMPQEEDSDPISNIEQVELEDITEE